MDNKNTNYDQKGKMKPCKIEISFNESGDWDLYINGKLIMYPQKFAISLDANDNKFPTFTLETLCFLADDTYCE